jgi:hypothetical protein
MTEPKPTILAKIHNAWKRFEEMDLRVGTIWLNPTDMAELAKFRGADFDPFAPEVRRMLIEAGGSPGLPAQPGTPEGHLWGAEVRCTPEIVDNHVAIAPDGMRVSSLDKTAGIPMWVEEP